MRHHCDVGVCHPFLGLHQSLGLTHCSVRLPRLHTFFLLSLLASQKSLIDPWVTSYQLLPPHHFPRLLRHVRTHALTLCLVLLPDKGVESKIPPLATQRQGTAASFKNRQKLHLFSSLMLIANRHQPARLSGLGGEKKKRENGGKRRKIRNIIERESWERNTQKKSRNYKNPFRYP